MSLTGEEKKNSIWFICQNPRNKMNPSRLSFLLSYNRNRLNLQGPGIGVCALSSKATPDYALSLCSTESPSISIYLLKLGCSENPKSIFVNNIINFKLLLFDILALKIIVRINQILGLSYTKTCLPLNI